MTNAHGHRNRLAAETSPYLLQHADNPVDWYPWSEEALTAAQQSGKPLLLSIGYSACHWCHVMAHESFEDEQTAALLNRLFVNVKVDREERPDIDRIYQTAHQLLTQRPGGWPLTMFLDPHSQRPFFGGTYFPKEARYGMPAFAQLIERVAAWYAENREEVTQRGEELQQIFGRLTAAVPHGGSELDAAPIAAARQQMGQAFDGDCGGFGGAPKFPQPAGLERLLRHWRDSAGGSEPDLDALYMVSLTLTRMAEGGLQDHLAGGFYRYAVDRAWQIPHFEKMLYDNGSLLAVYAQAFLATGEPLFGRAAGAAADWLLADMQAPGGGFFASRDADSAGGEGRFYVWTREEARQLLPAEHYEPFARRFGLVDDANFEGRWHLAVRRPLTAIAAELGRDADAVQGSIEAARRTLLEARGRRPAPGRDEKQLASWNALAIRGLALAANALQRTDLAAAAAQAADFIEDRMTPGGRLCASYKDGRARFPAYLDDHAFLLDALLELLQCDWQRRHLAFAVRLADTLLERFFDAELGGFFFTADDHEALMHRPKPLADEAVPSGNGIAALALQRLGFLLSEPRYLEAAAKTLRYAWQAIEQYPHAHVTLVSALAEYREHPEIIIIRGAPDGIASWRDALRRIFAPRRLVFAIDNAAGDLPAALAAKQGQGRDPIAYRCVGDRCSRPIRSREALTALLHAPGNGTAQVTPPKA